MESLVQTLEKYGAEPASFRSFADDSPELLPYATLLSSRQNVDSDLAALAGVYEWQTSPLVALVDAEKLTSPQQLDHLRRLIAMRGDTPYLGVIRPGQLTVYRVSLDNDALDRTRVEPLGSAEERATFPYLGNQRPDVAMHGLKRISKVVLKLLSASIADLKSHFGIAGDDAISLVGRALFTRFLADRGLLPAVLLQSSSGPFDASGLFDSRASAARTSSWLDSTFNGDFLPVSQDLFEALPPEAFTTLGDILRHAVGSQLLLPWEEKWANLNFAHIPVGVLSEAYEHYLREHAPEKQRKEGGYYTPSAIADMLVRGAFHALRRDGAAHSARILDPAAGAGVFLITAFRHLVAERWRHDSRRPDTKTLRSILYRQITGFDINESAMRFAALGLYLAAIELDPNPEPVEKLRFENLRGRVLHNMGDSDGNLRSLGSLSDRVGGAHLGRYDLVVGNPPWSSGTGLPNWASVKRHVAEIAHTRVPDGPVPKLPNEVLDLPFVWRAMEWARQGGQIAFALHARLLFQQAEGMSEERAALFGAINVTGIVNGSEIRSTKVWPEISAPFCLLYARNELPPPGAGFKFVSPRYESSLNTAGAWRVDVSNAETITFDQVIQRPEILKIAFRGSQLDLEIYDRLITRKLPTLDAFWRAEFGADRKRARFTGNGYQKLRESSEVRGNADRLAGQPASHLHGLLELTPAAMETLLVDPTHLGTFCLDRIHRGRSRELFRGPLLIVHEAPPAKTGRIRVAVADQDVVFNQSYNGYSAHVHAQGRLLVRYLALLLGSRPAIWHALMVSGRFGFEREVIEKFTIDKIPVPPFDEFGASELDKIERMFGNLAGQHSETGWEEVDEWAAKLYGLRQRDLQVIADTLAFNLPFADNRKQAQTVPSAPQVTRFCRTLESELKPWAQRSGKEINVVPVPLPPAWPWGIVRVGSLPSTQQPTDQDWREIMRIADQLAATEIVHPDAAAGCLWLARLNQARYWSTSQARLTARRITWEHVDFLVGLRKQ